MRWLFSGVSKVEVDTALRELEAKFGAHALEEAERLVDLHRTLRQDRWERLYERVADKLRSRPAGGVGLPRKD